jgi:hypothetical protein
VLGFQRAKKPGFWVREEGKPGFSVVSILGFQRAKKPGFLLV